MKLPVSSYPAISIIRAVATTSRWLSRSSSCADIRSLIRSSSGAFRLASARSSIYVHSLAEASWERAAVSGSSGGVSIRSAHWWNSVRSAMGTPRSSQITCMGSGMASALTRSARPSAAIRSSSVSVISCTRGRRLSTLRAVNALASSLRSRVCWGGLVPATVSSNSPLTGLVWPWEAA
ncbi:hypothetical protein [Streptomyces malaysiensis]|uniref:Uncharacterized protein n=1 Tax=Streptomyces malaysiensis subsp. samsunensis TaxID=459658 RepID=A0A9X2M5J0_STRMQ|nr:hypothetical protein [Streptomyces samsunensis]MCQ8835165.1 hypothetical protein [Streptomyces samsunensis]